MPKRIADMVWRLLWPFPAVCRAPLKKQQLTMKKAGHNARFWKAPEKERPRISTRPGLNPPATNHESQGAKHASIKLQQPWLTVADRKTLRLLYL